MPRSSRQPKRLRPRVRGLKRLRERARDSAWDLDRRRFFDDYQRGYQELRSDPEAWRAELEERAAWDPMLVPSDWDQFRGVIDTARDTARAVFADHLRDFAVEHTVIHDTGDERLCLIVSVEADEDTYLALRRKYHRALRSVLSPAEWSYVLVCVEFA